MNRGYCRSYIEKLEKYSYFCEILVDGYESAGKGLYSRIKFALKLGKFNGLRNLGNRIEDKTKYGRSEERGC